MTIFWKFDINYSYFKILYFGTPKGLKSELNKSGYDLKDTQGQWEVILYEWSINFKISL